MHRISCFVLSMGCLLATIGIANGETAPQRIRGDVVALNEHKLEVKTGSGQVITVLPRPTMFRVSARSVLRTFGADHARHVPRYDGKARSADGTLSGRRSAHISGIDARHRRRSSTDGYGTGQYDDQCHGDQRRGGPERAPRAIR